MNEKFDFENETLSIPYSKESTIERLSQLRWNNSSIGFDRDGNIDESKDNESIYLQIWSHDESLEYACKKHGSRIQLITDLVSDLETDGIIEFVD